MVPREQLAVRSFGRAAIMKTNLAVRLRGEGHCWWAGIHRFSGCRMSFMRCAWMLRRCGPAPGRGEGLGCARHRTLGRRGRGERLPIALQMLPRFSSGTWTPAEASPRSPKNRRGMLHVDLHIIPPPGPEFEGRLEFTKKST